MFYPKWCETVLINGERFRTIPLWFKKPLYQANGSQLHVLDPNGKRHCKTKTPNTMWKFMGDVEPDPRNTLLTGLVIKTQYGGEKESHSNQTCRNCHDKFEEHGRCLYIEGEDDDFKTLCLRPECIRTFPYENIINPEMIPVLEINDEFNEAMIEKEDEEMRQLAEACGIPKRFVAGAIEISEEEFEKLKKAMGI